MGGETPSLQSSQSWIRGSVIPGLLGRPWRPSVARSAWSFGGNGMGVDHAARAPAAYLVAGRADRIGLPGGALHGPCAGRDTLP